MSFLAILTSIWTNYGDIFSNLPTYTPFSLAIICLLPWFSRRSHRTWLALQVFDSQEKHTKKRKKVVVDPIEPHLIIILSIAAMIFLPGLLIFVGGHAWLVKFPVLRLLRDCVAQSLHLAVVYPAIQSLLSKVLYPKVCIGRQTNISGTEHRLRIAEAAFGRHDRLSSILARIQYFASFFLAVDFIWMIQHLSNDGTIWIMYISGSVNFFFLTFWSDFCVDPVSLGQFCLLYFGVPLSYVLLYVFVDILLRFLELIYFYSLKLIGQAFFDNLARYFFNLVGRHFSNDATQVAVESNSIVILDDNIKILLQTSSAVLSGILLMITSSIVTFAHRYDVHQSGQGQLTRIQIEYLAFQSNLSPYSNGRRPVQLNRKEFYLPNLTSKDLPTFNAAWSALIIIQVFGIIFDAKFDWRYLIHNSETDGPIKIQFPINIWPLVALPFIFLAMTVRVRLEPHRSVTSLWNYSEAWVKKAPSVPKATTKAATIEQIVKEENVAEP